MNQCTKAIAKRTAAGAPDRRQADEPAAPARRTARAPAGSISKAAEAASSADAKRSHHAGAVENSEPARATTKKAKLIALLSKDAGADIATLSTALGWQAHTTRAALTGLRKGGHRIETSKQAGGGGRFYRILPEPASKGAA